MRKIRLKIASSQFTIYLKIVFVLRKKRLRYSSIFRFGFIMFSHISFYKKRKNCLRPRDMFKFKDMTSQVLHRSFV